MDGQHLHILWTNADPVVFDKMVLMYAVNSLVRGWWEKVTVILWGETARLAAADPAVRERIVLAMEQGVKFSACITCAKELGVEQALRDMGLEVISWGPPLTELLKTRAPADRVTETKKADALRASARRSISPPAKGSEEEDSVKREPSEFPFALDQTTFEAFLKLQKVRLADARSASASFFARPGFDLFCGRGPL